MNKPLDSMADCRNADGTYDGSKVLSMLSGISDQEIAWMFKRAQQLMRQGLTARDASNQANQEARAGAWKK